MLQTVGTTYPAAAQAAVRAMEDLWKTRSAIDFSQRGRLTADEAYDLSRLDEAFQQEQWGIDEEAAERTANQREEARALAAWLAALDS